MTKEECSAQNGVIKDGSLDSDTGCGECMTCDGKLLERGTYSGIPTGFGCEPLNGGGSASVTDMCCKPCSCINNGKLIYSQDEINEPGNYCLNKDVTITKNLSNGTYTFNNSSCGEYTLTLDHVAFNGHINANVYTVVNSNIAVNSLNLSRGGEIKTPMNSGILKLEGAYKSYIFTSKYGTGKITDVKCIGFTSARLEFKGTTPENSGYIFNGSDESSCALVKCTLDGELGEIASFGSRENHCVIK